MIFGFSERILNPVSQIHCSIIFEIIASSHSLQDECDLYRIYYFSAHKTMIKGGVIIEKRIHRLTTCTIGFKTYSV